ncbi:GTP-binding protein [Nocardia sp. NPDC003693]
MPRPRPDLEYHNAMGTKAIDPQSIRNVTIVGDPEETGRVVHHLLRRSGKPRTSTEPVIHWAPGRVDHTIRVAEVAECAPLAELERALRVADGLIVVVHAGRFRGPRLETLLRIADDHQVARLCLITGLNDPAADFDRCVRTIADTRGATPLPLQIPIGTGANFDGVIDLVQILALQPLAAELYGPQWNLAESRYRALVDTVLDHPVPGSHAGELPLNQFHHRVRRRTRIGDLVPILCSAAPKSNDIAPLLDAMVRYLPSPLDVCQPEHALDY